jgi:hypothetical protein
MSNHEIHELNFRPTSTGSPAASDCNEKKDDAFPVETTVVAARDAEEGEAGSENYIYDNIPEGIDPRLIREEKVVRGLQQRHIQVRWFEILHVGDC